MNITYILSIFLTLSLCNGKRSTIDSNLILQSIVKDVFDLQNNPLVNRMYLIEIKLTNKSDSIVEFLTQSCTPGSNLIFDSEDIIPLKNTCAENSIRPVFLKRQQEFSYAFLITSTKNSYPSTLRVGWVFLTRKNTGYVENYFNVLGFCKEHQKNIIWSSPIKLDCLGNSPFEIRQNHKD